MRVAEYLLVQQRGMLDNLRFRVETAAGVIEIHVMLVVEPAVAPDEPVRPNPRLALFLAVLGGLVVAVGTAALIEYLDDALRDRRHAERQRARCLRGM